MVVIEKHRSAARSDVQNSQPLSALQEGVLFHHLAAPEDTAQTLSSVFQLQSEANVAAFIAAVQRVVDRHDLLRAAVFCDTSPHPVQVIHPHATLAVDRLMLNDGEYSVERLREQAKLQASRWDLRKAPLVCVQVASDSADKWVYAILHVHRIVCDYRSLHLIVQEIVRSMAGHAHLLPPPAVFREHAMLSSADAAVEEAEAYFRNRLGQVDEPTAPFGERDAMGEASKEFHQILDPVLVQRIEHCAHQAAVETDKLFHAAWALVVAHTSRRDEVVFGTIYRQEDYGATQARHTVGPQTDTLPLRLHLEGVSVEQLVCNVAVELQELSKFAGLPMSIAQRCSAMPYAPAFTTSFMCRGSSLTAAESTLAGVRILALDAAGTHFTIAVTVEESAGQIGVRARTHVAIEPARMVGFLRTAVESIVEAMEHQPTAAALSLGVLPANEHDILESFNATARACAHQQPIHELFADQARRTPQAVAVVCGREQCTYEELNRKSNQLAHYLRSKGAGPEELVGICMERGVDLIVCVLGVIKAGAAYVPLDPAYPLKRLREMLEDASPCLVLTQDTLRDLLPPALKGVIVLDTERSAVAVHTTHTLSASEETSGDLVYVIYTSGSTGRPKGTAMTHRAMVNLIEWHRANLPLDIDTRVSQFAAFSFDVAFQEIFSTLCLGATLVMVNESVRRDARALLELLASQSVRRLFIPPVMLQGLAESQATSELRLELQDIVAAGEQLRITPEIVALCKQLPGVRLHNHYGPTETHVVTTLTLEGDPETWPALPTIGRPIWNTQIHILDPRQRAVPIGIAGEIYIGGQGLARGYLRRADLTRERFLDNPFDRSGRIYKTGDLGRWRSDGTIEYLGRNDDQLKIRGFRIEPREVEERIKRAAPQVKDVVVVAREDVLGDKRLAAYLVERADSPLDVEVLQESLRSVLPEHMLPNAYLLLDALPLTPSGKLNRRALPTPQFPIGLSRQHVPPQGTVEPLLAQIWQTLLGVLRVGGTDNFFGLGGNSMTSLRLVVKIMEEFSVQLSVATILRCPMLQQLAQAIETDMRARASGHAEFDEGVA